MDGFKALATGDTAADGVENFTQWNSHRDFHEAGVVDLAGQSENFGAGALFCSKLAEPLGTIQKNSRNIGQGFHIVDNSGTVE